MPPSELGFGAGIGPNKPQGLRLEEMGLRSRERLSLDSAYSCPSALPLSPGHCHSLGKLTPSHPYAPSVSSSVGSRGYTSRSLASTLTAAGADIPVNVVVNVRPLLKKEANKGCKNCLSLQNPPDALPEVTVVGCSFERFPFDQVYGRGGVPSTQLFHDCVAPLVDGLFDGYNASVLAYGQTGAGKTYTIGTQPRAKNEGWSRQAVIPQVAEMLFAKASALSNEGCAATTVVSVSFLEIYRNTLRDLLASNPKSSQVRIRERGGKDVVVEGLRQVVVSSAKQLDACLQRGVTARATHATDMNNHSSRSHAIVTINLQVKRWRRLRLSSGDYPMEEEATEGAGDGDDGVEEVLTSKMHIVDLAGSERLAKGTVQVQQRTETASINLGLLSLRNCIEALCRPNRGHVPYRSHKLTRLLQDSLGGNAHTTMIACVSPSDSCMEETLSTLKYTSTARNIKNKVVANRDEKSGIVLAMMEEIRMLREQLAAVKTVGDEGDLLGRESNMVADSLMIETLVEERDSWRTRAMAAESRCSDMHKEMMALKGRPADHDGAAHVAAPGPPADLNSATDARSSSPVCSSTPSAAAIPPPHPPPTSPSPTEDCCLEPHPSNHPKHPPSGQTDSSSHQPKPLSPAKQRSWLSKLFSCVSVPTATDADSCPENTDVVETDIAG